MARGDGEGDGAGGGWKGLGASEADYGRGPLVGLTTSRPPPQHRAVVSRRCPPVPPLRPPLGCQSVGYRTARGGRGVDTARTARRCACSERASRWLGVAVGVGGGGQGGRGRGCRRCRPACLGEARAAKASAKQAACRQRLGNSRPPALRPQRRQPIRRGATKHTSVPAAREARLWPARLEAPLSPQPAWSTRLPSVAASARRVTAPAWTARCVSAEPSKRGDSGWGGRR